MLQPAKGERITRAPFDETAAAAIYRVLQRQFAHWRARLLHNLHNEWAGRGIAKGEGDTPLWHWVDDAIDDALDPPSDTSMRDVADAMAKAHAISADHVVKRINLDDPNALLLRTHTEAVNYAAHRAAEMVGKKYNPDGNLIDNPNADWAITDRMRRVLREEIHNAVGLHWDVDKLADRLVDTGLFSDARAEMIARTEINMAQNQGTLAAGRQAKAAGLNVRKVWTLGPNPCEQCQDAAAEGDLDLEDDFGGDAGDAPPLHPNCECNLDLFVADEEEEAKMQDDDTTDDRLDGDSDDDNGKHVVDQLADLIAEAGSRDGEISRQDALRWLLHSPHGAALIARVAQSKRASNRKDSTMTRTETLTRIVKQAGGLGQLCEKIVKRGTADVSEGELVGMATEAAKQEFPHLTSEAAFTKLYASSEVLRRAIMVAKAAPMPEPERVGDDDATDVNDPEKALARLREMIAELRRHAHITESEAWTKVARENPRLAKRAIAA
jgi:hypothetical protein